MLSAIPTNIITGFLGVGKTTAIRHLLATKPVGERWAVLVNEFGEVGIDGSIYESANGSINKDGNTNANEDEKGIFIREVPGGCMCCASGVPMQVALNMLLARAKPQRLLIEPTGLGHPQDLLELLSAEHYRDVLDLRATITLVDARKISDSRYTDNAIFNQQLDVADLLVANKADAYDADDMARLAAYIHNRRPAAPAPLHPAIQGAIDLQWLAPPAQAYLTNPMATDQHRVRSVVVPLADKKPLLFPETGFLSFDNQGSGFCSRGWLFEPTFIFDNDALYHLLLEIDAERIKGVFITDQGGVAYNKVDGQLTQLPLGMELDNRLECIAQTADSFTALADRVLACRLM